MVGLLVFINLRLALITLAIAPVVIFIALAFRRIARHTTTQARRVLAEVNANVQESITGIGVAKNFRQEQRIYDEFKPVNAQTYRLSLRQGLTFSSIFPILGTISGIGTALIVYAGGMSVIGGAMSAGESLPVHREHQPVLVPADQHCLLLEPVPARSGSQRTRLRPDRRRAARRPDR